MTRGILKPNAIKKYRLIAKISMFKKNDGEGVKTFWKVKSYRRTANGQVKMTIKEFMDRIEFQNEFEREYLSSENDFDCLDERNIDNGKSVFGLTYNGGKVKDPASFKVKTGSVTNLAEVKI